MLALAVRYLTGRAVAADPGDRSSPEWPPHPGRLFMCLVAAWGAGGRRPEELQTLEWLEELGPPAMRFSAKEPGANPPHFVPTNDPKSCSEEALPAARKRAERLFPSVVPDDPTVHYIWPAADPEEQKARLAAICERVTYLGHSHSLVHVWMDENPPPAIMVPTDGRAELRVRVASRGRLSDLEASFAAGRWPSAGAWHGYVTARPSMPAPASSSLAGDLVVLRRVDGSRLSLPSTLMLVDTLRAALLSAAAQPPPEELTGHAPDGSPSKRPHIAIFPLADVGHEHAEGGILGLGVVVPRGLEEAGRQAALTAVAGVERLVFGREGAWTVETDSPDAPARRALAAETWCRPSRRWASVTPVVLDRFPKREGDAEEAIAVSCERVGLSRPVDVIVGPVSLHQGVPHARDFGAFPGRKDGPRRWHCHAVVTFGELVEGPVLLGAGRYRGYGLLRPLTSTFEAS